MNIKGFLMDPRTTLMAGTSILLIGVLEQSWINAMLGAANIAFSVTNIRTVMQREKISTLAVRRIVVAATSRGGLNSEKLGAILKSYQEDLKELS